ncbi:LysR family transcriptional regulator [Actinobacillus succinogenes]|uniref:Transcriptional regulator, LysR family n=1 Tax=Actinobacillus succinogenes (strain ATCC 55618 / DSM 22257 / CCUG 43843 / 130Z) TaxID=339671 RepID=A6VPJ6_ACTSZ|nr:LysR family transcriptional regulator [Actinobacillus succinogenes]ABR74893.1 transcriptional regulator, LysR family [Actinobacillus succinogenes 130Z]PHI40696.1 LysR family transcriptional regulator [Actinobacillus succinogenes]
MNSSIYGYLTVFHAIAEQGGIAAASRKLEIAPPSVSQSLKLLEKHIGLPLFNRTTRKMELTEAGLRLLENTEQLMRSLEYAVESVQDLGEIPTGTVRITVPRFAYQLILKPHFAEFCRLYPHIRLEISVHDGTVDILQQGFDLGIRFGDKIEQNMVARKLLEPFHEGLYVSRSYAEQYGIPLTPQDLHRHFLIGYRFITSNRIYPLTLSRNGQDLIVEMESRLISNDIDMMADAVRAGLGIGRIFSPIRRLQPDADELLPVLKDYWKTYPPVYLYYPQHSQKAKRIQVLIEFLSEKFKV